MKTENAHGSKIFFLKESRENFSVLPFARGLPDDFLRERVKNKNTQDIRNPKFAKSIYQIVLLYQIADVPPDGNSLYFSTTLAYLITCYGACATRRNLVTTLRKFIGGQIDAHNGFINLLEVELQNFLKTSKLEFFYSGSVQALVKRLRSQTDNFMRQHKDDFYRYLKEMPFRGIGGRESEINVLCNLLECNIQVYDEAHHKVLFYKPKLKKEVSSAYELATLYLSYESGNHYSFLFLETNFQREHRENFSVLPFAAICADFTDDFDGFFDDERIYNFESKPHVLTKFDSSKLLAYHAEIFVKLSKDNKLIKRFNCLMHKVDKTININFIDIFRVVIKGFFVGACIEAALWQLPACSFVKICYDEEMRNLSRHDYFYTLYPNREMVLLLRSTPLDSYLSLFLNCKKPMFVGSFAGASINLANYFGLKEHCKQAFNLIKPLSDKLIEKKPLLTSFFRSADAKNDTINQVDLQPGITASR